MTNGDGDTALAERIKELEDLMHGTGDDFGIKTKINLMWRLHLVPILLIGGVIGSLVTLLVNQIAG